MDERKTVAIGIGELYVTKDPSLVLAAYGLGSCVGVSVYDPSIKAAGLAHVMLPSSNDASSQSTSAKFADVAIPSLIEELLRLGALQRRLVCKIAGGAQMLNAPGHVNSFRIGERNIQAVTQTLRARGLAPHAADTGGSQGRTMRLFVESGKTLVRTVGRGDVEL